jgi:hypothetical protein
LLSVDFHINQALPTVNSLGSTPQYFELLAILNEQKKKMRNAIINTTAVIIHAIIFNGLSMIRITLPGYSATPVTV